MDLNDYQLNEICAAIMDREIDTGQGSRNEMSDLIQKIRSSNEEEAGHYLRAAVYAQSLLSRIMSAANRVEWVEGYGE